MTSTVSGGSTLSVVSPTRVISSGIVRASLALLFAASMRAEAKV
jgi:hypothetical protein